MSEPASDLKMEFRPYGPSWIDRFTDWVGRFAFRGCVFYLSLGLLLLAIQFLVLWMEAGSLISALLPVITFNALGIPYILALIHLLDNRAVAALNSMKRTLDITEPEFSDFRYKLSTMPARPVLIVGLLLAIQLVLSELYGAVPERYAALAGLPVFSVIYHLIDKLTPFLFGPFVYHTVVQLRLVNTIISNHARANLFDLKPLYSFSSLTAATAMGLLVPVYGWMLINPDLLRTPLSIGMMLPFSILPIAVFVWPLVGAHRLMETEKEGKLREIDLQFEAVFERFNQNFKKGDFNGSEQLNGTISSLNIQHTKISAIPTWPWRPETVGAVLTAIALPLVLRIIQFIVDQAFGL